MIHQLEEYVYPGGFRTWLHTKVLKTTEDEEPLSKRAAFIINVPLGWTLFGVTGWLGSSLLWVTLPALSILFVNAWFHIVLSLAHNTYVPGTNTSILIHLPLTIYAYYYVLTTWQTDYTQLMTSIMIALILHMGFLAFVRRKSGQQEPSDSETRND